MEGAAGARRLALPADRRQLRQRLLRRHPRHGRRPGRAASTGRLRPRDTRGGQARRRSRFSASAPSLGLVLAATTTWWLLLVGAVAIGAAWTYTGGSSPYGYRALGEVSVFVFFGLVAVVGTTYVQLERVTWPSVVAAVGVGALACAILVANNLRDIPTDTVSGKRTLAVVLGDARSRRFYIGLGVVALAAVVGCASRRPGRCSGSSGCRSSCGRRARSRPARPERRSSRCCATPASPSWCWRPAWPWVWLAWLVDVLGATRLLDALREAAGPITEVDREVVTQTGEREVRDDRRERRRRPAARTGSRRPGRTRWRRCPRPRGRSPRARANRARV